MRTNINLHSFNFLGQMMKNVFVSPTNRFLYFRGGKKNSDISNQPSGSKTKRIQMKFSEYLDRCEKMIPSEGEILNDKKKTDKTGANDEHLYLYGEPVSGSILEKIEDSPLNFMHINISSKHGPNIASQKEEKKIEGFSATSALLWVAGVHSTSPLHYDLSEGLMLQLNGEKKVILFKPGHNSAFYPHTIGGPYDRQSRINCIKSPNLSKYPSLKATKGLQGIIKAGEILYIPYGYWHQIESPPASVGLSLRWNPYEDTIRAATQFRCIALGLTGVDNETDQSVKMPPQVIPKNVANMMYRNMLSQTLPGHVTEILLQRFAIELEEMGV